MNIFVVYIAVKYSFPPNMVATNIAAMNIVDKQNCLLHIALFQS